METLALTVDECYTVVRQLRLCGCMDCLRIADKVTYQTDAGEG